MSAAERFRITFFLEAARLASRSLLVDSVLGQTMPKLPIDGFNYRLRVCLLYADDAWGSIQR
jgi:hypothetical protein